MFIERKLEKMLPLPAERNVIAAETCAPLERELEV